MFDLLGQLQQWNWKPSNHEDTQSTDMHWRAKNTAQAKQSSSQAIEANRGAELGGLGGRSLAYGLELMNWIFNAKVLKLSAPCDGICHNNEIYLFLPCRSSLLPVPSHWSLSEAASVLGPVSQARVTCGVQHVAAGILWILFPSVRQGSRKTSQQGSRKSLHEGRANFYTRVAQSLY